MNFANLASFQVQLVHRPIPETLDIFLGDMDVHIRHDSFQSFLQKTQDLFC